METRTSYDSPLGRIILTAEEEGLTGLWFQENNSGDPASQKPTMRSGEGGSQVKKPGMRIAEEGSRQEMAGQASAGDQPVIAGQASAGDLSVIAGTRHWLDQYFAGREPDFTPRLHLTGSPFRLEVWEILLTIPYGETMSYGRIAQILAGRRGIRQFSAQAVGNAVGHNPVSLIVPCHRVIGSKGSLVGYGGGLDRKEVLLALEQGRKAW